MKNVTVICPICKKTTSWQDNLFRPFCSERCKLLDLGKWASDEYRVAGEKKDSSEENGEEENPDEL
jgi:endogenous inhibitor of DNA gyrase (YacG/DUF329 family)